MSSREKQRTVDATGASPYVRALVPRWMIEDGALRNLPGPSVLVLWALAGHADLAGECWPSIARVCRCTGLEVRSVKRGIRTLRVRGLVAVELGKGRGRTSRYRILLRKGDAPDTLSPTQKGDGSGQPRAQKGVAGGQEKVSPVVGKGDAPDTQNCIGTKRELSSSAKRSYSASLGTGGTVTAKPAAAEAGAEDSKTLEALAAEGIVGKAASELLVNVPGLTAGIVRGKAKATRGRAKNPPGLLLHVLGEDGPALVAAEKRRLATEAAERERLEAERLATEAERERQAAEVAQREHLLTSLPPCELTLLRVRTVARTKNELFRRTLARASLTSRILREAMHHQWQEQSEAQPVQVEVCA